MKPPLASDHRPDFLTGRDQTDLARELRVVLTELRAGRLDVDGVAEGLLLLIGAVDIANRTELTGWLKNGARYCQKN